MIRNFMIGMGPVSSLFDFLTFFVLFRLFQADEKLFHTGWFVESLVTQVAVLLVIRTLGNPIRSRPSQPLLASTLVVVGIAVLLPYSGLAPRLGFVPLPVSYLAFVAGAVAIYLIFVEFVKRRSVRSKFLQQSGHTAPAASRLITLLWRDLHSANPLATAGGLRHVFPCTDWLSGLRAIRRSTEPESSSAATWSPTASALRRSGQAVGLQ